MIVTEHLPETKGRHHRLGRHVNHDPRSWNYPAVGPMGLVAADVPLVSKTWPFPGPPLDQGDLGACTGNATAHLLRVRNGAVGNLDEAMARRIYSSATVIDSIRGQYPPDDTGSDGLSALKAAQGLGLFTGTYRWCKGLHDVLAVLSHHGGVIIGIPWHHGFDSPDSAGHVRATGAVEGGHEVLLHGIDVPGKTVMGVNSWGDWGPLHGHFVMAWSTLGHLLEQRGDAATIA